MLHLVSAFVMFTVSQNEVSGMSGYRQNEPCYRQKIVKLFKWFQGASHFSANSNGDI